MKTSDNGRHFIELWEGLYLHTYNDGVGVPTIGYGHTSAAGPPRVHYGMICTRDEADQWLAADLASVESNVSHHLKVPVSQNVFDACVSFDFNTGAFARSNVMRALNLGATQTACEDLLMWDHGGGHVMPGLLRRRKAEQVLWREGKLIGP